MNQSTLQSLLNDSLGRHGPRRALEVDGVGYTYAELDRQAAAGAAALVEAACPSPFVIVFGYRSAAAFIGILSAVKAGKAYLPVSHKFPPRRLAEIFRLAQTDTVVLGAELAQHFRSLLDGFDDRLPDLKVFYLPSEADAMAPLMGAFPRHHFRPLALPAEDRQPACPVSAADDFAYMLFTSGSTGQPKGIAITHANVCAYLEHVLGYFGFQPSDRFSQCFDLTFDYSVHDMFSCWLSGACLCVVPAGSLMAPARFVEASEISVWFSVPSLAMTMDRLRMLKRNRFPRIRLSLFGGEAVSRSVVEAWQEAAPHSSIFNVYGPTEATINITHYRWDRAVSPGQCVNGCLPLGYGFPGLEIRIVDDSLREVPAGAKGQLLVSGPQVARGYYRNDEKTAQAFRMLPADDQRRWYLTGDVASRDEAGLIQYFGRTDFQVQICGHRVELAEVEAVLRRAARTDYAVALPWPYCPETGRADYLVAVLAAGKDQAADPDHIGRLCRAGLPDFAVPSRIVIVDDFPLNINGKIDRAALVRMLGEDSK